MRVDLGLVMHAARRSQMAAELVLLDYRSEPPDLSV